MKNNAKVGLFVLIASLLFFATIYFIGSARNLFGNTIHLKSNFKNVTGLKLGNNVRFSGINIGSIKSIEFVSDTIVLVNFIIKKEVQKYIKIDAFATISTDGLMGDKILEIAPGSAAAKHVEENNYIRAAKALEVGDLMKSLKVSIDNAALITNDLAQFTKKINNKNGTLSKLLNDESMATAITNTLSNVETTTQQIAVFSKKLNNNDNVLSKLVNNKRLAQTVDTTINNLHTTTQNLNETIKAAQSNFLLRGYFNKKKKESKVKK